MQSTNILETIVRLGLAVLMGGAIGFDREFKHRPAGIRTHILVCVGATLIALIQRQIQAESIRFALDNPQIGDLIRSDPARLICQIVSGIGFLGAGTIIVTKRSVTGLTTAASLWAIAGLGIAIGMGYYVVAVAGFVTIFVTLTLLKKVIHLPTLKRLEIQYGDPEHTREYLTQYFAAHKIEVRNVDYSINFSRETHSYTNIYTLDIPKHTDLACIIQELTQCADISKIRVINL